ncbi:hypothetical protein HHX47_DHR7000683 [Lentinula edodes]|nr:hypothetical protein HHX47_DHR7000683 [Lentinula edodes]
MFDSGLPPGYDANDQDVDLPAYSSLSGVGREVPSNLTDLSDGASKEFTYNIPLKGNKSSASLVLYGNALISKHLPTFLEDSKVDGLVKVDVESGESINAVVISIQGKILSGAKQHIFLDYNQTLWSLSDGHTSANGKLQGIHDWPFSVHLPKEVSLTIGSKDAPRVEVFRLPQTFMERHARASIQYEVIARFSRGLLKTDHRYHPEENKAVDPKLRKDEFEHSELATWWPLVESSRSEKGTFKRTLSGEIVLSPDLMPTTFIGRFQLEYSVVLFPFDANNFQPGSNNMLVDCAVEIATNLPPGPRPRIYRPEYQSV